jgi:hypothetical protein
VGINMQIALGFNRQINPAMPGNLVEHVIKETDSGGNLRGAAAIKIDRDPNSGLEGVTRNFCVPHSD